MFNKILVANRGEIARRIFAACRELGVTTVAIYSEVDAGAAWLDLADEAYLLPGATAVETYLNRPLILDIARRCGAEAIHPGYGFLSENADFAAACAEHGLVFIGPSPEAMRRLGSKASARAVAEQAGVPVVPGVDGLGKTTAELLAAAEEIGFPVLIKASAGGGGKGMRVVERPADFADAVRAARSESQSSFGSGHLLLEKYFTDVHHVEIQVLGDSHGTVLHLFERECSVQRRHQKIIEESPAPIVTDDGLRQQMAAAAVALAQVAGYENAGTVEFIVDGQGGGFYFLEMNTRLQVEHPVTEMVTGLDLATWQIRIAAGERLSLAQADIRQRGHALECRVYAEDPANHFLPSTGEIVWYKRPFGPNIRVDDGIATGSVVTPYYDPMLAKVITWGASRAEAIAKMVQALESMVVLGITTNIPYLLAILQEPQFQAGRTNTHYLATHLAGWKGETAVFETEWLGLAAMELLAGRRVSGNGGVNEGKTAVFDPWGMAGGWRNVA
ncbi:MAG: acetyl-CoA carboxylase biotin carboxylase subunit [Anaerolineales bacterium]|nr:acetyl-CoA carboxylase biotin carboxylase subunit [Anaerolineales bacterium]